MQIDQVDPEDLAAIEEFHAIQVEVGRHDRPDGSVGPSIERTVAGLRGGSGMAVTAFLGRLGDEPVALGWCGVYGEPSWAYLLPRVLPEFRRHGYGTAMLSFMEQQASIRGGSLRSNGAWAGSHGPAGHGSATVGFAAASGWELGPVDASSRLMLPVPAERLTTLAALGADRRRGYTITVWAGPVLDGLLGGWDALGRSRTEPPPGSAAAPPTPGREPDPTSAAVRQRNEDRRLAERGAVKFSAAACSPAGDVVACTFLTAGAARSEPAAQQRTFVSPEHRGHGLGLAMKVDLLALVQRDRPDIPAILTRNRVTNAPIVAINQRLGYVRTSYSGSFHRAGA